MVYENKTEWRRSTSFESSKFMQAVPFKVLLIMKSVHKIVTIAKKSESNVSANLTAQLSPSINLLIAFENPKVTESNSSKDKNKYITAENELVETSSKIQNSLSSFTPQTRNTYTAILDHGASCNYTIIANNLTVNLKEFADLNWELDIPSTMSAENIIGLYKQNMQAMFKSTKIIRKICFLMHQIQDCRG